MRFRYKGKRYRLNVLPFVLMLLALTALIVLGTAVFRKKSPNPPGSSLPAGTSSGTISAGEASGGSSGENPSSAAADQSAPSGTDVSAAGDTPAGGDVTSSSASSGAAPTGELPAGKLTDWNLILLNPAEENAISTDLDIQKTKFDTQWVDSRAAPAYQAMYDAAKKEGITLFLRSGYRSISTQKTNYDNNVKREIANGNNEAEAIRLTNLYYTVPGHSEHHSGLAFDIITPQYHNDVYTLSEKFAETDAYKWLVKNCADYGFVLRYPKDKQEITKINFEPWHYRYVGVEHAKYMTQNNLCLEEYIALLKEAGR